MVELAVDRVVVGAALAGEAVEQLPAQVGVDLEPVESVRAVEQPGEQVEGAS